MLPQSWYSQPTMECNLYSILGSAPRSGKMIIHSGWHDAFVNQETWQLVLQWPVVGFISRYYQSCRQYGIIYKLSLYFRTLGTIYYVSQPSPSPHKQSSQGFSMKYVNRQCWITYNMEYNYAYFAFILGYHHCDTDNDLLENFLDFVLLNSNSDWL